MRWYYSDQIEKMYNSLNRINILLSDLYDDQNEKIYS